MHRFLLLFAIPAATCALALAAPALAAADTTTSSNWSGYAAHGKNTRFKTVTASWTQPAGDCRESATSGYSAFWVGIGGYSYSSDALEQIGTELDCTSSGATEMSAWYELVPAASRTIALTIRAGDRVTATVVVAGHKVTLSLIDHTSHRSFTKIVTDKTIDDTSAEWIAEAPSVCQSSSSCQTLTLADFGSVAFTDASATTTTGRTGAIKSTLWDTTEILLGTGGTEFASNASSGASATPTALTAKSRAFSVAYTGTTTATTTSPATPVTPPGGPGGYFGRVR